MLVNPATYLRLVSIGLAGLLLISRAAIAHEIPNDVTLQVLVKPEDERMRVLVRVPLEAMQDIEFPVTGPGYLDIPNADQQLRDAANQWIANDIRIFENGEPLGRFELINARASIPSDRSFSAYESALASVQSEPLPAGLGLIWQQALLDVLFEVPIESVQSDFSIETNFARLGQTVVTVIRYLGADGTDRLFQVTGNSGNQPLDPGAFQAAFRFLVQGFTHILDGMDHLLFLLCLVVPFRAKLSSLIWIVTAFTVAHSITLIGSAYGLAPNELWFPPLVETLIAASILYMAIENTIGPNFAMRWGITFGFGLIHGFGFSFALRNTLQFAGDHVLTSLLAFNVGVELGQLLVLLLLVPVLIVAFRYVVSERVGILLISILVGHVAWHWMADRYQIWRAFGVGAWELLSVLLTGPVLWVIAPFIAGASIIAVRRRRIV